MMILGMGKLGGRELNYSSDIDLVFLYPEEGQTDGARSVDNAEFFLRLGQKITQLLATPTAEGFVYRVDLRLRPFGDSGRLALSFGAFEELSAAARSRLGALCLCQGARDHRRGAFPCAVRRVLRPFVYRRYLDFSVFESLRDMKAMIAREVERRELQDNVKLGPGGIREIEFIVQAFQLIRGGADRRLQSRELRRCCRCLSGNGCCEPRSSTSCCESYRYLAHRRESFAGME